jgi:hypothetical protein
MKQHHTPQSRVAGLVAALAAFGSLSALATAQPAPPLPAGGAPAPPPTACGAPAPSLAGGVPPPPPTGGVPPPPPGRVPAPPLTGSVPGAPRAMVPGPTSSISGAPPLGGIVVATRPYRIQIQTGDGRYVNLNLRNGTVINPLGTSLVPGMCVVVRGVPGVHNAIVTDEIDVRVWPPAIPNAGPAGPGAAAAPPAGLPAGPPPPPPARR